VCTRPLQPWWLSTIVQLNPEQQAIIVCVKLAHNTPQSCIASVPSELLSRSGVSAPRRTI
jgi:hypothetical protein